MKNYKRIGVVKSVLTTGLIALLSSIPNSINADSLKKATESSSKGLQYLVKEGDTSGEIIQNYFTSNQRKLFGYNTISLARNIMEGYNAGRDADKLSIGDKILIPVLERKIPMRELITLDFAFVGNNESIRDGWRSEVVESNKGSMIHTYRKRFEKIVDGKVKEIYEIRNDEGSDYFIRAIPLSN